MLFPLQWTRYWHTLRHLKARQWTARLKRKFMRPTADLRPAPPRRGWEQARWQTSIATPISLLKPNCWRLLNEEHELRSLTTIDPTISHLWRYHLHYFDDLRTADAASRTTWQRNWISDWLEQCPTGTKDAWDPYPTSLRIVNWLKWAWQGGPLSDNAWQSLAVQARWLAQDLEYHLLGNHLLANAKALVFAGAAFGGDEGDRWLHTGLEIYREQLPEQILSDGGHFELSPMYHALILEDLLDVWNLAHAAGGSLPELQQTVRGWEGTIQRMRHWLAAMTHPDGSLAHFNDSTQGQSATTHELEDYAQRLRFAPLATLGDGLVPLTASGYMRCQLGDAVLILDVGEIGPKYLPGHAHADTLSFELSLGGVRALVNSGISCYGISAERLRQRGTAAHNTVVVNEADSSEVWSGFRVARRASITEFEIEESSAKRFRIRAAHDGYRRLHKSIVHRRWWTFEPRRLLIEDEVTGSKLKADSYFRLGPGWQPSEKDRQRPVWRHGERTLACVLPNNYGGVVKDMWHPGFGLTDAISGYLYSPDGSRWTQDWTWT